jgi:hypothetical protein
MSIILNTKTKNYLNDCYIVIRMRFRTKLIIVGIVISLIFIGAVIDNNINIPFIPHKTISVIEIPAQTINMEIIP